MSSTSLRAERISTFVSRSVCRRAHSTVMPSFFGKSFTEAVELLTGEKGAAQPPDRPSPASFSDFRLPPRSPDNRTARNYLTAARRIDEDVSGFFFSTGDIYEEAAHHNAVFVGRDEDGVPRYAHQRGTAGSFRLDVKGSDKAFNFCYRGEGERLFVFEAPIDLLSFLCLFKKDWQKQSYLALGGVGEKALLRFLSDRPNIKTVYLCLDSDQAGNDACSRLAELVPEGLTVHRLVPLYKDWNEVQTRRAEIADGKYIREAIYGLKEPPQEETVEIIRMSEVDTQTVEWLWEPYIPFGKVTIVQGNPGEGKTTFALRLAAYAGQHPDQCRQTDTDPETGCMEFDIVKGRFSFRLTAPYNEERREAARRYARENNAADRLK